MLRLQVELLVPEIADYELRRELLRAGKTKSINRLNNLIYNCLIPLDSPTMKKAAELWSIIRRQGRPTASNDSLDGDVIIAAQAIMQLDKFDQVVIVTTNLNHILQFEAQGIKVKDFEEILNNLA